MYKYNVGDIVSYQGKYSIIRSRRELNNFNTKLYVIEKSDNLLVLEVNEKHLKSAYV